MTTSEALQSAETPAQYAARRLRGIMAERQISSGTLSAAMGLEQSAFSRRYRGRVDWSINELASIANLIGVRLVDLLPGMENAGDQVAADVGLYAIRDSNPEPADLSSALVDEPAEQLREPRRYGHLTAHDGAGEQDLDDPAAFVCPFRVIPGRAS